MQLAVLDTPPVNALTNPIFSPLCGIKNVTLYSTSIDSTWAITGMLL